MKEHQHTEWKETWRDEYLRWICGFANAEGGVLVIGRNDKGVAVGVPHAKKLLEDLPNKVRDVLGIMVAVNLVKEGGTNLIEIRVEPYPSPVSYKGEYHYRSGSTKQELRGAALERFLFRHGRADALLSCEPGACRQGRGSGGTHPGRSCGGSGTNYPENYPEDIGPAGAATLHRPQGVGGTVAGHLRKRSEIPPGKAQVIRSYSPGGGGPGRIMGDREMSIFLKPERDTQNRVITLSRDVQNYRLVTRNEADFMHVAGLELINPMPGD